jgi:nucleotide-binding universal stress UspA family protein
VVGVDGSIDSLRAVTWAADRAARSGCRLVIVHAGGARRDALARAAAEASRVAPSLEVRTLRTRVAPVVALRRLSSAAELLVVARRGRGGVPFAAIGTTAGAIVRYARCPVVAIPKGSEWDPSRPVVVGVDGSKDSRTALAVAVAEAHRRGVRLIAVHVCADARLDESPAEDWRERDWDRAAHRGRVLLEHAVHAARAESAQVRVDQLVMLEEPTRTLLYYAERAQLLVVGARGRGGFPGLPIGSTATTLFGVAACPVIVVRARRRVVRRARAELRRTSSGRVPARPRSAVDLSRSEQPTADREREGRSARHRFARSPGG